MNSEQSKENDNEHVHNDQEDPEELSIINFEKKVSSEQTEDFEQPSDDYHHDLDYIHGEAFGREVPE